MLFVLCNERWRRHVTEKNTAMKHFSYLAILFAALTFSCKKSNLYADMPPCIAQAIQANENNPDWEIGSIEEYSFQGQTVYAFVPDIRVIADGATMIQSADCNRVCSVGGFGGPGH